MSAYTLPSPTKALRTPHPAAPGSGASRFGRARRRHPAPAPRCDAHDWARLAHAAAPLGVVTVDVDGCVTDANPYAQEHYGISDRATGRHWQDALPLNFDGPADDPVTAVLASGQPAHTGPVCVEAPDAHARQLVIDAAPLDDPPGTVVGVVLTIRELGIWPALQTAEDAEARVAFQGIVGQASAMKRVFEQLPVFARSDSTVLIDGASGTGKELVARALHRLSPRKKRPFVAINCGALPDTLLESELFGHKRGAFTDAVRDKPGRFAAAEGGTLFLDEIGDISPAMQVRLLRVLQERQYEPLGSVTPIRTNVRVVVATHHDLHDQVRRGKFRDDLLYRIDVVRLQLPSLSDRREDIPLLAEHFVSHFNRKQGKDVAGLSPAALRTLLAHDYPGNVRELENIIEHAFVLIEEGLILPEHLPPWLTSHHTPTEPEIASLTRGAVGPGLSLHELEDLAIDAALGRHHGNRRAAARELGINPSTLFRKLRARQEATPRKAG